MNYLFYYQHNNFYCSHLPLFFSTSDELFELKSLRAIALLAKLFTEPTLGNGVASGNPFP